MAPTATTAAAVAVALAEGVALAAAAAATACMSCWPRWTTGRPPVSSPGSAAELPLRLVPGRTLRHQSGIHYR